MISFSALMTDVTTPVRKESNPYPTSPQLHDDSVIYPSPSGLTTTTLEMKESTSSKSSAINRPPSPVCTAPPKRSFFQSISPYTVSPPLTSSITLSSSNGAHSQDANPLPSLDCSTAALALNMDSPQGDTPTSAFPTHRPSDFSIPPPSLTLTTIFSSSSEDAKAMVYMGVDCVMEILSVQSSRTRDFCRLFVKIGLLGHISRAFDCIHKLLDRGCVSCSPLCPGALKKRWSISSRSSSLSQLRGHERKPSDFSESSMAKETNMPLDCNRECQYLNSIANIYLKFSRSDASVALHMAGDAEVIQSIMTVLTDPRLRVPVWNSLGKGCTTGVESRNSIGSTSSVQPEKRLSFMGVSPCTVVLVETLLKCLKNLSMESSALSDLEKAGTIPLLISLLGGCVSNRCKTHIVPCIFNLCRINKRRQEDAAIHGIIPHLQCLIANDSHLKQFALPILCSLAYTSSRTRAELLKHGGAAFYINLLKESYWQTFALNSLAVWYAPSHSHLLVIILNHSSHLCFCSLAILRSYSQSLVT